MRRRITIALSLLVVAALGTAATVAYMTLLRAPTNAPAEVCTSDRGDDGRPRVVAAGASIVQGTLGADWVSRLRDKHQDLEIVNAGRNGDTSAGLLDRMGTDVVACAPIAVVILVGSNEVRDQMSLEGYSANLDAIVARVKARTDARIALVSLPPLGEDLSAPLNASLAQFNNAIHDSATEAGVAYLPLHEQIAAQLRGAGAPRPGYDFSFLLAFTAATRHYLLRQTWDEVARSEGLEFLVDHIHLSDQSGALLTDLTSAWLASLPVGR